MISGYDNTAAHTLDSTTVMFRAWWPSSICPANGLHGWEPGVAALLCVYCEQYVIWEECWEVQRWNRYWVMRLSDMSLLN